MNTEAKLQEINELLRRLSKIEVSEKNWKSIELTIVEMRKQNSKKDLQIDNLNRKIFELEKTLQSMRTEMYSLLANRPIGATK